MSQGTSYSNICRVPRYFRFLNAEPFFDKTKRFGQETQFEQFNSPRKQVYFGKAAYHRGPLVVGPRHSTTMSFRQVCRIFNTFLQGTSLRLLLYWCLGITEHIAIVKYRQRNKTTYQPILRCLCCNVSLQVILLHIYSCCYFFLFFQHRISTWINRV
jgi:hypothetical protein